MSYQNSNEARQAILEAGRRLYQRGYVAANDGNISARMADGTIWATPTGVSKGFMTPDMLVRLTPEGEIVLRYAERLRSLYDKMLEELNDSERHMTKIRVGITHTAESNRITEIHSIFGDQEDNNTITVITDTIKHLYNMLAAYQLDLAFIEEKPSDSSFNHILLDTDYLA